MILSRLLILQEIELTEKQNDLPMFLKPEKGRAGGKNPNVFNWYLFLRFCLHAYLAFPRDVRDRLRYEFLGVAKIK